MSLGDGHWLRLDQGGDIGSLPGGGQAWLLPTGVLYEGGGRLFFGQANAMVTSALPDMHASVMRQPDGTPDRQARCQRRLILLRLHPLSRLQRNTPRGLRSQAIS